MGVLWSVFPLDGKMKSWLDENDIAYPDVISRLPTGQEVKDVVGALEGYDVQIHGGGVGGAWQATIGPRDGASKGEWTVLNITEYSGDDEPQDLWFEKGWDSLMVKVLARLARSCGPLVLLPDTGEDPQVVVATPLEK